MRVIFDSSGLWGVVKSAGWDGDRLVFEGDAHAAGVVLRVRETITKAGPDDFGAVWESQQASGWVAYSVETLRRMSEPDGTPSP